MDDKVNSHIQITKSLMKNFSVVQNVINDKGKPEKHNVVYCYDFATDSIELKDIKILGTEYGYFSKEAEIFLSNFVENNVGDLIKKFKEANDGELIEFSDNQSIDLGLFLCYSFIRSNFVVDIIKGILDTAVPGKKVNPPQEVALCLAHEFVKLLGNRFFTVVTIAESCDREFIIPRNCFYICDTDTVKDILVLPFTPQRAFAFVLVEYWELFGTNERRLSVVLDSHDNIDIMNDSAYLTEKAFNNAFLVSKNKKELERYLHKNIYIEKDAMKKLINKLIYHN